MGNYCYLRGWDPTERKLRAPALESKNAVPVYWLAMFDALDVHDASMEGPAFEPIGEPTFMAAQAHLVCAGALATERLSRRLPGLVDVLGARQLGARFVEFARQAFADQWVVLELSEIASMRAPGAYATTLRDLLPRLNDAKPSRPHVHMLGELDDDWDTGPFAENLLVGWGTGLTAREREGAPPPRPTPAMPLLAADAIRLETTDPTTLEEIVYGTRSEAADLVEAEQWEAAVGRCRLGAAALAKLPEADEVLGEFIRDAESDVATVGLAKGRLDVAHAAVSVAVEQRTADPELHHLRSVLEALLAGDDRGAASQFAVLPHYIAWGALAEAIRARVIASLREDNLDCAVVVRYLERLTREGFDEESRKTEAKARQRMAAWAVERVERATPGMLAAVAVHGRLVEGMEDRAAKAAREAIAKGSHLRDVFIVAYGASLEAADEAEAARLERARPEFAKLAENMRKARATGG